MPSAGVHEEPQSSGLLVGSLVPPSLFIFRFILSRTVGRPPPPDTDRPVGRLNGPGTPPEGGRAPGPPESFGRPKIKGVRGEGPGRLENRSRDRIARCVLPVFMRTVTILYFVKLRAPDCVFILFDPTVKSQPGNIVPRDGPRSFPATEPDRDGVHACRPRQELAGQRSGDGGGAGSDGHRTPGAPPRRARVRMADHPQYRGHPHRVKGAVFPGPQGETNGGRSDSSAAPNRRTLSF